MKTLKMGKRRRISIKVTRPPHQTKAVKKRLLRGKKKLIARKDGEQATCAWRRGRKSKMATDVGIMPR